MPEGIVTALDLMKVDAGALSPLIEENIELAPELSVIPADTISGTTVELSVRTDLPEVFFRHANEGVARTKGNFVNRLFQTHLLDHRVVVDEDEAISHPKGLGRYLESHMSGALQAAIRKISKQFYYGGTKAAATHNDPKGPPGIIAQYAADADHEVNAGGSTGKTSVWFLRVGRETIEFLFGQGQTLRQLQWLAETVQDENGKEFRALCNWLKGRVGVRLANRNAAVRIKNIGTDNGKGLTDDLMFEAWNKFVDLGWEPNLILMNGRSQEQHRKSRITDLVVAPPLPTEFQGAPIVRTAQIMNGETV